MSKRKKQVVEIVEPMEVDVVTLEQLVDDLEQLVIGKEHRDRIFSTAQRLCYLTDPRRYAQVDYADSGELPAA